MPVEGSNGPKRLIWARIGKMRFARCPMRDAKSQIEPTVKMRVRSGTEDGNLKMGLGVSPQL